MLLLNTLILTDFVTKGQNTALCFVFDNLLHLHLMVLEVSPPPPWAYYYSTKTYYYSTRAYYYSTEPIIIPPEPIIIPPEPIIIPPEPIIIPPEPIIILLVRSPSSHGGTADLGGYIMYVICWDISPPDIYKNIYSNGLQHMLVGLPGNLVVYNSNVCYA